SAYLLPTRLSCHRCVQPSYDHASQMLPVPAVSARSVVFPCEWQDTWFSAFAFFCSSDADAVFSPVFANILSRRLTACVLASHLSLPPLSAAVVRRRDSN